MYVLWPDGIKGLAGKGDDVLFFTIYFMNFVPMNLLRIRI